MWYEVPKQAPAPPTSQPKAIFPWEEHRSAPTRVFADLPALYPSPSSEREGSAEPQSHAVSSVAHPSMAEQQIEPPTPTTPTIKISQAWNNFTRTNAWDDVPEIEKYVDGLQQKSRRTKNRGLKLGGLPQSAFAPDEDDDADVPWRFRGLRVTDFPVDRPSLPVTPAPLRRSKFWGGGGGGGSPGLGGLGGEDEEEKRLPAAAGVPAQSDWVCAHGRQWRPADCLCDLTNVLRLNKDPLAQLQKLARQQSELLQKKLGSAESDGNGGSLGGNGGDVGSNARPGNSMGLAAAARIPSRALPLGSETAKSPAYVAAHPPATVLSPQPRKPSSETSSVRNIDLSDTVPVLNIPRAQHMPAYFPRSSFLGPDSSSSFTMPMAIPEPSYSGPGRTFEKGEPGDVAPRARSPNPSPRPGGAGHGVPEPSYSGPGLAFEKGGEAAA